MASRPARCPGAVLPGAVERDDLPAIDRGTLVLLDVAVVLAAVGVVWTLVHTLWPVVLG